MQSPLRYPGGKSNFVATVAKIIRASSLENRPFYEPYAGSAAVSLGLLASKTVKSATILERDPLIYSFWRSVLENPDGLISRFRDLPITLDTWNEFKVFKDIKEVSDDNYLDLGLAGLFFNRTNFSGILKGGPIGGHEQKSAYKINCRTNKDDLIKKIEIIAKASSSIDLIYGDAIDFIKLNSRKQKVLFYIDPPYFNKGESLYRYFYKLSDHKRLADVLKKAKFPWILSYDSHHVIEFLYDDFYIRKHKFQYSAGSAKTDEELLISNFKLPDELKDW